MNTFSHITDLFNASGCLSPEALEKYAGKQLSTSDMKLVEEHLAGCPFCKDALEGASQVHGFAAHSTMINERLRRRFRYIPARGSRKGPVLSNFFIPAAASVIVLAGIIAWFHYFYPEKQELAVVLDTIPVQTEQIEIQEKSEATTMSEKPAESTTIGGVFPREEDMPGAPPEQEAGPAEEESRESAVTIVVVEEDVRIDDPVVDEVYAEANEVEIPEENIEVMVLEEKAGAGHTGSDMTVAKKSASGSRQKEADEAIFVIAKQMPEFPGGMDSLQIFLEKNLIYPEGIDQTTDTTVIASFMVSKKGKIKDINIVRSAGKAFDDEVIRVIRLMPDFIPASKGGKAIAAKYNLPIRFESE